MAFDGQLLKLVKKWLNYDDDQLAMFSKNERNEEVFQKSNEIGNTILVLTVVESHGCNSQHKIGDRIYLDGAGNLLTKYSPAKICTYALHNAILMLFAANEFIYSGISPMDIKFRRCSCFDVGVSCGGLGRIVLELTVMDMQEFKSVVAG